MRWPRSRPVPLLALAAGLGLLVSGCGQKGPLYLPKPPQHRVPFARPAARSAQPADTTPKKRGHTGQTAPR